MPLQKNSRVAVIGSGISSLTYTYFLSKLRPDLKITVFEEDRKHSGYVHSKHYDYKDEQVILQKGPRTLRSISPGSLIILDLVKRLGLEQEVKYINSSDPSNKKWLVAENGHDLVQLPNSFRSFLQFYTKDALNLTKIFFSVLREPFIPKKSDGKDETIHEFFSRRFSPLITSNFLSAVYRGIYAGDVKQLSAAAIMPSLGKMEQEHGSIIKAALTKLSAKKTATPLSDNLLEYGKAFNIPESEFLSTKKSLKNVPMLAFSKGLASFTHGLFNEINRIPNVTFNLNTPVKVITNHSQEIVINDDERFDHIRSTINSNKLLEILGTSKPEFHLKYVDIYMVNIFTPRNDLKISGFGYLVPQAAENKEELLGCIFDSDIEKNSKFLYSKGNNPGPQQEYTKLTLMFGGHQWLGKQRPNDEEMLDRVHSVLQKHLGMSLQDTDVIDHTFIPQCIPQFEKEYVKQKEEFHKWLKSEYAGRITHGGMSYGDGCGVPDVVMNSFIDAHAACK